MTKTYKIVIGPEAEADLFEIYNYISTLSGARRGEEFVARIEKHCLGLSLFPERGVKRDDLRPNLRLAPYRRQATVAYMIDEVRTCVVILRVFGAGRDYEAALRDDEP